ncbi:hypothetical protein SAY86_026109 [Trapa natans]|uniref:Uncharacterized protein n=1 Tax=Trapa natans TaxID=22666 RepID=A0AAN7QEF1_TRANT|nr:hypothetical protein SAY86_026109 [Trapa natans]
MMVNLLMISTYLLADNQDASSSENSALSPALSNSALERLQLHMRLQGLSSPLSLYNNPVLWPKIHSLHDEKTVDNLQLSSKNNLNNIHPADRVQTDHLIDVNPRPGNDLIVSPFYEPAFTPDSISWVQQEWIRSNSLMKNPPVPEETSPSIEQMLCGDSVSMGSLAHDISSLIHSEHQVDGILGNYCSNTPGGNDFMPQESVQHHQVMLELDCIKGILDDSSSWDGSSDSVDVQAGGSMFQGYETGYNNI